MAFAGTSIREFVAPPSLREAGIAAFLNCKSLTSVSMGAETKIRGLCFWGTGLQQVRGKNVWQRPPLGIASPALTKLVLPDDLRVVRGDWFSGSDIRDLLVSQGVEEIQDRAFAQCRNLAAVAFAEGSRLRAIGAEAFADTSITSFVAPRQLRTIKVRAFCGCSSLRYAEFSQKLEIQPDNVQKLQYPARPARLRYSEPGKVSG